MVGICLCLSQKSVPYRANTAPVLVLVYHQESVFLLHRITSATGEGGGGGGRVVESDEEKREGGEERPRSVSSNGDDSDGTWTSLLCAVRIREKDKSEVRR